MTDAIAGVSPFSQVTALMAELSSLLPADEAASALENADSVEGLLRLMQSSSLQGAGQDEQLE